MIIRDKQSLKDSVDTTVGLSGSLCSKNKLIGRIQTGAVVVKDYPAYEGSYVVTPTIDDQILNTAQKLMTEDMTIEAIPYHEVTNNSGGITAIIGNEALRYGNF